MPGAVPFDVPFSKVRCEVRLKVRSKVRSDGHSCQACVRSCVATICSKMVPGGAIGSACSEREGGDGVLIGRNRKLQVKGVTAQVRARVRYRLAPKDQS